MTIDLVLIIISLVSLGYLALALFWFVWVWLIPTLINFILKEGNNPMKFLFLSIMVIGVILVAFGFFGFSAYLVMKMITER